jgi:hypothetical protein
MVFGVNSCIKSQKQRHSDLKVNSLNINKFSVNTIQTKNMRLVYSNILFQFYLRAENGRLKYGSAMEIGYNTGQQWRSVSIGSVMEIGFNMVRNGDWLKQGQ